MSLHASSYFAGVATVVATMMLGFGGGILMTDALVGKGKGENSPTLAERRASPQSEQSTPVVAAAPHPTMPAAAPVVAAMPSPVASGAQPAPRPDVAPVQASAPTLPIAQQPRQNDEAMARARDDDVKKMLAAERRKAERRQWAERRKLRKIEELNAVAEKVKEAEREPVVRSFVAQSPPRINLIGID